MAYGTRLESVTRKGSWVQIPPPPQSFAQASELHAINEGNVFLVLVDDLVADR